MVASTYMLVRDQKVTIILSIYTVKTSNEDQAIVKDIRKKDIINKIRIIMIIVMLQPLEWRPVTFGFCSLQFAKRDGRKKRQRKEQTRKKIFS